ncbi:MAG TPA: hypothetical protein DCX46_05435 [Bacteroidetes bacterium]|nr:hypothetical protein [Bacteroidota bacterium]
MWPQFVSRVSTAKGAKNMIRTRTAKDAKNAKCIREPTSKREARNSKETRNIYCRRTQQNSKSQGHVLRASFVFRIPHFEFLFLAF